MYEVRDVYNHVSIDKRAQGVRNRRDKHEEKKEEKPMETEGRKKKKLGSPNF
jgi:hypothetical protein